MVSSVCFGLLVVIALFSPIFSRDLTLEPGHMKPFGFGRPNKPIDEVVNFPSARSFFKKYVHPRKPVKMKGAAKYSEAYYNWNDEYFLEMGNAGETRVSVETMKKESRQQDIKEMKFKDFVKAYNTSGIYMVDGVPEALRKDVVFPCVLQCDVIYETLLVDNVMWFSSGGTKSVVHTDSVENINCLFRGEKELVMIDPALYGDKVNLDHPEGSYSGMDVDAVDYTKYPGMADVEFYHVLLQAGDCLYIPFKWIHQVRSYQSNLAVNIWWKTQELQDSELAKCKYPCDPEFTMDKVSFKGFSELLGDPEEVREQIKKSFGEETSVDFHTFMSIFLGEDVDLIVYGKGEDHRLALMKKMFIMFSLLDANKDNTVSLEEVETASDEVMGDFVIHLTHMDELMERAMEEAVAEATKQTEQGAGDQGDQGQEGQEVKDEL